MDNIFRYNFKGYLLVTFKLQIATLAPDFDSKTHTHFEIIDPHVSKIYKIIFLIEYCNEIIPIVASSGPKLWTTKQEQKIDQNYINFTNRESYCYVQLVLSKAIW